MAVHQGYVITLLVFVVVFDERIGNRPTNSSGAHRPARMQCQNSAKRTGEAKPTSTYLRAEAVPTSGSTLLIP